MWELAVPNKYLKKKYLRSVANIYLIEPIIENQWASTGYSWAKPRRSPKDKAEMN